MTTAWSDAGAAPPREIGRWTASLAEVLTRHALAQVALVAVRTPVAPPAPLPAAMMIELATAPQPSVPAASPQPPPPPFPPEMTQPELELVVPLRFSIR